MSRSDLRAAAGAAVRPGWLEAGEADWAAHPWRETVAA